MNDRHSEIDGRNVDAAFNRVLAAEVEARSAIEQCQAEAAALVAAAEREARAIANRAERRIRAAHRIADRGIERVLADLGADGQDSAGGPSLDAATVERLVALLAAELTGWAP
jgi:regulator of protease activity HflC (stomatin/prohibitin superfamily)